MAFPATWTEFFGPSMWKAMHAVAFASPERPTEEERMHYVNFFRAIGPVIPCPACRAHYMEYIEANPLQADSRESLARWVYDLHDDVNRRTKKRSPPYEQVRDEYTGWNEEKHKRAQALPVTRRLAMLADPHMGRTPGGGERLGGERQSSNLFTFLLVGALVLFLLSRRRSKEKENLKE